MTLKRSGQDLYRKMPSFLGKYLYKAYSMGMKVISPLIVSKIKKGKFLNRIINKINDIDGALEFAFSFQYLAFTLRTAQIKYEINKLLEILNDLNPRIILEIGTAGGGTLFLFTRIAHPEATIISVDLPGGPFGGGYTK